MFKEINQSQGLIAATLLGAIFMLAVVGLTGVLVLAFKWCLELGVIA